MPTDAPSPEDFDRYAAGYDQALNRGLSMTGEPKEYYARGRIEWTARRLPYPREKALEVLDFGCGIGSLLPHLKATYPVARYTGYDPSVESIRVARQTWGTETGGTFVDEASRLENGAYDLVFTNGVFHHIPPEERGAAVALIWRALRPGGHFAFWENNRWNPFVHWIMSRVEFDRDAQLLFPFQARALLRGGAFEIVGTDALFVFPASLRAFRSLEPRLCKLPLGGQYLVLARKPARA